MMDTATNTGSINSRMHGGSSSTIWGNYQMHFSQATRKQIKAFL